MVGFSPLLVLQELEEHAFRDGIFSLHPCVTELFLPMTRGNASSKAGRTCRSRIVHMRNRGEGIPPMCPVHSLRKHTHTLYSF